MSKSLESAAQYLSRGFMPIPIPHGSKNPNRKGWQAERWSHVELPRQFNNGQGVGLLLGDPSGGLLDVDCDWPEAAHLAIRFLPKTSMISGRLSAPQSHYWFMSESVKTKRYSDPTLKDAGQRATIVEIRSTGCQTIVPPSVHPSGEAYVWHEFTQPERIESTILKASVARLAVGSLLARHWGSGKRHDVTLALAGTFLVAGWSYDTVKNFIEGVAEAAHDEEIQDRIHAVETTYEKFKDHKAIIGLSALKELLDPSLFSVLVRWLEIPRNPAHAKFYAPSGFRVSESGVHAIDPTGEREDTFICSKMVIGALTRNKDSEDWGRLLEFSDLDEQNHTWAMPMSLLSGDGNEYRSRLLNMGLTIAPNRKARELLTTYIQTAKPDERVRCVDHIGWHNGVFVLPDETFGENGNERVLFQSRTGSHHNIKVSGMLQDWQTDIAGLCVGNSRLIFAVSCGFAGALLPLTGEGGGGFHLRGPSTTGKTTAQLVAGSVWGGSSKGYLQTWRTTINGLEAIAELHNHSLLCLDEIGQCDPREVGEIAYLLANGIGKARMTRGIAARKKLEWDLIFLSSGERTLSDIVESIGKPARGGQEVRMCDLPADARMGLGIFEILHGFSSPSDFARHLSEASKLYYGTPIRSYLAQLVEHKEQVAMAARSIRKVFIDENVPLGASSEVSRAASRFALVAAAGESAQEITHWPEGEAIQAAAVMFKAWLDGRGTKGSSDIDSAVRQVRAFIEAHGSSRFQAEDDKQGKIINRVGFKRKDDLGKTEYLVLPEAFRKEVCAGYDYRIVARALAEQGYMMTGNGKRLTLQRRFPELGQTYVYAIKSKIVSGNDDTDDSDDLNENH